MRLQSVGLQPDVSTKGIGERRPERKAAPTFVAAVFLSASNTEEFLVA
jgi:hypothetical protein